MFGKQIALQVQERERALSCTGRLRIVLALVVPEAERRDSRKRRRPRSIATISFAILPLCAVSERQWTVTHSSSGEKWWDRGREVP